ncbi:MAG TPA: hypothetical protein VGM86_26510 [Thermoanaerobaculia bacterium]|jgi:hypothetical protein
MFRRGQRIWRIAALALALLWTASPGWAAARPWQSEPAGWTRLWEKALAWLAGGQGSTVAPAGRPGHEKYSAGIDPNGQPAPASTAQSDSSSQIDPLGSH